MTALFEALTGQLLLQPLFGLLLALPALGWVALRWWQRTPAPRGHLFAPAPLLAAAPLPATWRTRLHRLPDACALLAALLCTVAVMRPVVRVEVQAERTGIDIVLCLDVSSSMAAKDLDAQQSRLQLARSAAVAFVAGRPDDRIGLVRFARFPDLVCPPTTDHQALEQMLGELAQVARDGPEDATGIGTAVARAVQVLSASTAPSRVVVLVTDGEENVAAAGTPNEIGPLQAAQLAQRHGVRVHALAVGAGAPAGGTKPIDTGPVDTAQVEQMAQRTGGRFFAVADAASLAGVYREIGALEPSPAPVPRFRFDERYRPWALLAFAAAALAFVLRRTWLQVLP